MSKQDLKDKAIYYKDKTVEWIKNNKGKITVACLTVIGTVIISNIIKNSNEDDISDSNYYCSNTLDENVNYIDDELEAENNYDYYEQYPNVDENYESSNIKYSVDCHIRNLPNNWNASQEKIEEAKLRGIELRDHQTIVDSYEKERKNPTVYS